MFHNYDTIYFSTIRSSIIAFASLFDNIIIKKYKDVKRTNESYVAIKVPLSFTEAEKFHRIDEDERPDSNVPRTRTTFPRIFFTLTGIEYAPTRQHIKTTRDISTKVDNVDQFVSQLRKTPFDLKFKLFLIANRMDDVLQMIEQILPYFAPSFNVSVKTIPELGKTADIPVILDNITLDFDSLGPTSETRKLQCIMDFTMPINLFPNTFDPSVIEHVIVNFYNNKTFTDPKILTIEEDA
jgi:hypothetical protein